MALPDTVVADLKRLLGPENVLTAKEDLIPYSFDGTAGPWRASSPSRPPRTP